MILEGISLSSSGNFDQVEFAQCQIITYCMSLFNKLTIKVLREYHICAYIIYKMTEFMSKMT